MTGVQTCALPILAKAIRGNPEVTTYVRELEQRYDAASEEERRAAISGAELPTSESVIRGVEEYLRGQWDDQQEEEGQRSEEHTSELQSHSFISYAVFCLKKKKKYPLQ